MRTQNVKAKRYPRPRKVSGIAQESGHHCTNATKNPRTSSSSSVRSVAPFTSSSASSPLTASISLPNSPNKDADAWRVLQVLINEKLNPEQPVHCKGCHHPMPKNSNTSNYNYHIKRCPKGTGQGISPCP